MAQLVDPSGVTTEDEVVDSVHEGGVLDGGVAGPQGGVGEVVSRGVGARVDAGRGEGEGSVGQVEGGKDGEVRVEDGEEALCRARGPGPLVGGDGSEVREGGGARAGRDEGGGGRRGGDGGYDRKGGACAESGPEVADQSGVGRARRDDEVDAVTGEKGGDDDSEDMSRVGDAIAEAREG